MSEWPNYDAICRGLRSAIIEHYYRRRESIGSSSGLATLDTNSTLVPRRAELLIDLVERRDDRTSLEGLEVADLGCGFGAMSLYFACAGARVTGVDPNDERFVVGAGVADEFGLDASFRRGWIEALPLPDRRFDLVVLNNSFCYLTDGSDRRCALAHVFRVTRPGGLIVMRNPSLAALVDPFTGLPFVHQLPRVFAEPLLGLTERGRARSKVRLRSAPMVRRELRRAGFEEVRIERDVSERRPGHYQHVTARRSLESGERPAKT